MSYTFTKTPDPDNGFDITTVTISCDEPDLTRSQLVDIFFDFLKSCGYTVKNNEDIYEIEG